MNHILDFSFFRLTTNEILALLEADDIGEIDATERILYVTPPDEGGNVTDVDSDNSDDEHEGDLNHLGRRLLAAECELAGEVQETMNQGKISF